MVRAVIYKGILAFGGAEDPTSSIVPPLPLLLVLTGEIVEEEVVEEDVAVDSDLEVEVCAAPASDDVATSVRVLEVAVLTGDVIEAVELVNVAADVIFCVIVRILLGLDVDVLDATAKAEVVSAAPAVSSPVSPEDPSTFGHSTPDDADG
ncbi:MAG: hypothetical protein Q9217_001128 [Psora testacea]